MSKHRASTNLNYAKFWRESDVFNRWAAPFAKFRERFNFSSQAGRTDTGLA